ncbi:hypothetical protein HWV62_1458 [Athelia sp. TMB]|nr:hypothetical protein HWV62_1458 [Athelia sp. TMB]
MPSKASLLSAFAAAPAPPRHTAQERDDIIKELCKPASELHELFAVVSKFTEEFNLWAPSTKARRLHVNNAFAKFIEIDPRYAQFIGAEWLDEDIMGQAQDFLMATLVASKDRVEGANYMGYNSFITLAWNMYGLINEYCLPIQHNRKLLTEYATGLTSWAKKTAVLFNLSHKHNVKHYFGVMELRLMVKEALLNRTAINNALQHVVLWIMFFQTAACPGSLLKTAKYPEDFLKYEDILVKRNPNGTFITLLCIKAWKGGHTRDRWMYVLRLHLPPMYADLFEHSQLFQITGVRDKDNLGEDLSVHIIAVGLRRHAFKDFDSVEELATGDQLNLRWKDEFLHLPFFVACGPKGVMVDLTVALNDNHMRIYFSDICKDVGLWGQFGNCTSYAFRRGTATKWMTTYGPGITKALMHHKRNTDALESHYDNSLAQRDIAQAVFAGRVEVSEEQTPIDAPALHRDEHTTIVKLTALEAIESDLLLQRYALLKEVLAEKVLTENDDWSDIRDTLSDADIQEANQMMASGVDTFQTESDTASGLASSEGQAVCDWLLRKVEGQFKSRLATVRKRFNTFQYATREDRTPLTASEVSARQHEHREAPSEMLTALRNIWTAQETSTKMLRGEDVDKEHSDEANTILISGDGDGHTSLTPLNQLMQANLDRIKLLAKIHEDETGAQKCPLCAHSDLIPQEKRERVYGCLAKVQEHLQGIHSQAYIGAQHCPFCPPNSQFFADRVKTIKHIHKAHSNCQMGEDEPMPKYHQHHSLYRGNIALIVPGPSITTSPATPFVAPNLSSLGPIAAGLDLDNLPDLPPIVIDLDSTPDITLPGSFMDLS